ncbi:MAG: alpha-ketoglutarate-dependent dioxygenase AlkB [Luteimonas sp.]|nr:alpha-ketoglutarate-dependent dioxygenase AlkB [Luteimonas sp.]
MGDHDEGGDFILAPAWLDADAGRALFDTLLAALPWTTHRVVLFGRAVDAPRLSCWIGDPGAAYRYSGVRHDPRAWPDILRPLRERLRRETGIDFNSVLANLYRDGRDCMGWHSDDEPELGARPVIASLSLGAARRFVLRHRRDPARRRVFELPHGSLLLMCGDSQADWRHALPRTAKPVGPRINLTFRRIVPAAGRRRPPPG